jgi:2-oxoisovalerate dehydrogenase E1 component
MLAQECFFSLDAPIERLAMPDIPSPHAPVLLEAAVPDASAICRTIQRLASV